MQPVPFCSQAGSPQETAWRRRWTRGSRSERRNSGSGTGMWCGWQAGQFWKAGENNTSSEGIAQPTNGQAQFFFIGPLNLGE